MTSTSRFSFGWGPAVTPADQSSQRCIQTDSSHLVQQAKSKEQICRDINLPPDDVAKEDEVMQKLHTKPVRHAKPWSKTEDEILIRYVREYPSTFRSQTVTNRAVKDLNGSRTVGAVKGRMIKIHKMEASTPNEEEPDAEWLPDLEDDLDTHDSDIEETRKKSNVMPKIVVDLVGEDDASNSSCEDDAAEINQARKKRVLDLVDKLVRYYRMEKNCFQEQNMQRLLKEFEAKRWQGDLQMMGEIMLNELSYFEEKLLFMERKHGAFDFESKQRILSTLEETQHELKSALKHINDVMRNIKESAQWLGDEQGFARITGCHPAYYVSVLKALDASKYSNKDEPEENETNDAVIDIKHELQEPRITSGRPSLNSNPYLVTSKGNDSKEHQIKKEVEMENQDRETYRSRTRSRYRHCNEDKERKKARDSRRRRRSRSRSRYRSRSRSKERYSSRKRSRHRDSSRRSHSR